MTIRRTLGELGLVLIAATMTSACGEEADRPSDVHTTRVLAVSSETPFAKPGSRVALTMLSHDGSPRAIRGDGSRRETSTLWIGGCKNPRGDDYAACMPYLREVVAGLGNEALASKTIPANAPLGSVAWGNDFVAEVPDDIVSSRPVAAGVIYPYGLEIEFFAYCGGVLRLKSADARSFPLGCFDAETGEELGRDDFEFGFYPLFVYADLENHNPVIASARMAGVDAGLACSVDAPCADGLHCGSTNTCIPVVERCTKADKDDCPSYRFDVEVPKSSVERAVVAHVSASDASSESVWISYYADGGSFEQDARIINDPHSGWSDDVAGKWRANLASSREVRLWAVVRDNRNGVSWVSRDVWVE